MTTLTEAKHTGAYLGSVSNPQLAFETATVKSGQKLKAGEVIELDGDDKIIACSGTLNSDGTLATDVVGILHQAVDASATGENADVTGQVYLARHATVKDDVLTYPAESSDGGEKAAVIASLEKLDIRPR